MDSDDKGFYDFDLNIKLETQIDLYEQDRQRYWEGLSGWSAIGYERAERFAQAVLKNSEQLIPVEEIDGDLAKLQNEINEVPLWWKRIFDILSLDLPEDEKRKRLQELPQESPPDPQDDESPLKLVWERFIINMSWEAIGKIEEGASRIFQLYNLVLSSSPSKSTQQFLGRLSRCYVWGFDPECIILCRAVIDTAFQKSVDYDICKRHFGKRRNYDLSDRIQAALNEKMIDEDIAKKARTVKERGNKAVHVQPGITKDVWGTIRDTVAVLERITQGK